MTSRCMWARLPTVGGRGVVTHRGLGDKNLWARGGDDLWAGGACTCAERDQRTVLLLSSQF